MVSSLMSCARRGANIRRSSRASMPSAASISFHDSLRIRLANTSCARSSPACESRRPRDSTRVNPKAMSSEGHDPTKKALIAAAAQSKLLACRLRARSRRRACASSGVFGVRRCNDWLIASSCCVSRLDGRFPGMTVYREPTNRRARRFGGDSGAFSFDSLAGVLSPACSRIQLSYLLCQTASSSSGRLM